MSTNRAPGFLFSSPMQGAGSNRKQNENPRYYRIRLAARADRLPGGARQALLSVHGFDASLIAGLVEKGFATLSRSVASYVEKLLAEHLRAKGYLADQPQSAPKRGRGK